MDALIKSIARIDGDLVVSDRHGFAYQHDMSVPVPYDAAYFDKYVGYEGADIARRINAGRVDLVNRHAGVSAGVLDIGIGSGEFIKSRPYTFGFDINPKAVEWLKSCMRWSDAFCAFTGFTFWDVLEHVETPDDYFRKIPDGSHLFTSLPIFTDLGRVRESRHYRPNEHFYYFTESGFVEWMKGHGFVLLERDDFETRAGRDSILSFAFRKCPI